MSKRSSAAPLTPRKKKSRLDPDQQSLDNFFRSPSTSRQGGASSFGVSFLSSRGSSAAATTAESEVIDVDALSCDDPSPSPTLATAAAARTDVAARPAPLSKSGKTAHMSGTSGPSSSEVGRAAVRDPDSLSATSRSLELPQPLSTDPPVFDIRDHEPWHGYAAAPYSFLAHALSELTKTKVSSHSSDAVLFQSNARQP
jgi:hypothetical protein